MAAGLGFKTFTTGEVLTAADTNGYLMQGVLVFASAAARNAAITSPQEGQYCYLKDTNSTEYYDGAAWVSGVEGDISGVTAGIGISGGGTSGTVTVTNSMATAIDAKGDLVPGTGADTFARLAVGANNSLLTAASGEATGLKYAGLWTTYTPTFSGTTLGNGSVSGTYCQIADTVFFRAVFTLGSTSSIAGPVDCSLPVTASTYGTFDFMNVISQYKDNSTTSFYPSAGNIAIGTSNVRLGVTLSNGNYTQYTDYVVNVPVAAATSDTISVQGSYRI
jgi:hypothetical protein